MKLKLALLAGLFFPVVSFGQYCAAGPSSTISPQIQNVVFAGINNATPVNTCVTYTYFSSIPGSMAIGSTYTGTINTRNACSGTQNKRVAVYIDWNIDGDFLDAGEKVFGSGANYTANNFVSNLNVTVPATAMVGTTRMRILLQEAPSADPAPCATYTYGEVEDYPISILCGAINGISLSRQFDDCSDQPESFTAAGMGAGVTVAWESSTDLTNWTTVSATNPYSAPAITQTTYYRVKATNASCSGIVPGILTKTYFAATSNLDSICPNGTAQLNSPLPPPQSFSNNTPYTIPTNATITFDSPITPAGARPALFGIGTIKSVCVNIEHTFDGDLSISLVDPSGGVLALSTTRGGTGENYTNTCFVPGTGNNVPNAAANAPFTGNYTAQGGDLEGFVSGKSTNATWNLRINDNVAQDGGRLVNWSINFNPQTVAWTPTAGLSNPAIKNPTASPANTTTYTAKVTYPGASASDCQLIDSVRVVVKDVQLPSVTGVTTICTGTGTTLNATSTQAGATFSWFAAATGGTALGTGPSFNTGNLTSTKTFYCESFFNGCASGSRTATVVTVVPLPAVPTGSDIEVCYNLSPSVAATCATAGSSIKWFDAATAGNQLATGSPYNPGPLTTTTTYYAESTVSPGCASSTRKAITVTVNPLPAGPTVNNETACSGSPVTFTATAPGGTYSWYSASTGGTATTGNTYTVTPTANATQADVTRSYFVTTTDAKGCVSTPRTQVNVVVKPIPALPTITTPKYICEATSTTVSATALNVADNLEWYNASTAGTLLITGANYTTPTLSTNTSYWVQVTRNGCTNPTRVKQDVNIVVRPVLTDPADKAVCSGLSVAQPLTVAPSTAVTLNWTSVTDPALSFSAGNGSGTGNGTTSQINDVIANTSAAADNIYTITSSTTQNGITCTGNTIDFKVTVNPLPAQPTIADKAICRGDAVSLVATAPGGTYNWYTSSTTPTVLFSGDTYSPSPSPTNTTSYYLTTTDANNCVSAPRKQVTLTVYAIPVAPTVANTTICQDSTATLTVTSTGDSFNWFDAAGNPVYTGQTYITPTIPSATTYQVSTTTNGCTGPKKTVAITTVGPPSLGVLADETVCSNTNINKTLTGSHSSGVRYIWTSSVSAGSVTGNTNPSTSQTSNKIADVITNTGAIIADVDYQVRAISVASPGCPSVTQNFQVQINPEFDVTTQKTDVICYGLSTGRLIADGSAAKQPASYVWKKNNVVVGTSNDLNNISAGTYNLTVSDADNCSVFRTYTVNQPAQDIVITSNVTNVDCFGNNTGAINTTVSNAVGTVNYNWSNTATTQNITGLSAGAYSLQVTDNNGCKKSANMTVSQPAAALSYTSSQTNVLCNGAKTGATSITVSGGTSISTANPYTYSWNTTATTRNLSNLGAGTYLETVTDKNGCKLTDIPFVITEPATAVSLTKSITNVECFGTSTGTIDITPAGGVGPYTYKWVHGPTTEDLSGLAAGTYNLTITDANGCKLTDASTLTQKSQLIASIAPKIYNGNFNVSCNGSADGELDLTVTGGTAPFQFAWSNSQTTEDIVGLSAGPYSVSIADASGCSVSASKTLTQPTALSTTVTAKTYNGGLEISCNGSSDGEISIVPSGGVSPYSTTFGGTATPYPVTGLTAGTYVVGFNDANGCIFQTNKNLIQPSPLLNAGTVTQFAGGYNIQCNGGNNGSIQTIASGGNAPYTYLWNDNTTASSLTNQTAGTYTVEIKDNNGCIRNDSYTLTQPGAISLLVDPVVYNGAMNIKCFNGNTGAINTMVSGGQSPFTYLWNNTATTANVSGLTAGTYSVEVTDANGCKQNGSATLVQPTQLAGGHITSSFNGFEIRCNGNNNGFINYNVTGGTMPYNYQWNTSATTAGINNLTAGNYQINVVDANGCTINANITLSEPPALSSSHIISSFNGFGVSCAGSTNGTIDVSAAGGNGIKSITWNMGLASNFSQNNLAKGTYTYTITDINNCSINKTVTLTEPAPIGVSANQNGTILCFGDLTGTFNSLVSGGVAGYTYKWFNSVPTQVSTSANPTGLPAGTYSLEVTDANLCVLTKTGLNLVQPNKLTVSTSGVDPNCFGAADGSVTATAAGGTPGYTYQWTNGPMTATWASISQGTKEVTVTDLNGCKVTTTQQITSPTQLILNTLNSALVSCDGKPMGAIQVQAQGGTTPYTYSWSNGNSTPSVSSLVPGVYTITLTDKKNCTTAQAYTVTLVNTPDPVFSFIDPVCGDLNSIITVNQATGFDKMKVLVGNAAISTTDNINYTVVSADYGNLIVRQEMNDQGCKSMYTDTIPFKDIPKADFAYDTEREIDVVSNEVMFKNTSVVSALSSLKYSWSIDGVEVSKASSPTLFLPNGGAGEYQICIDVTNGFGCADQYCEPIIVKSKSLVYVPNSFTPDNDGFNDEFAVQSQGIVIDDFSFTIVNRSGVEIFKTKDPHFKWDGKHNGETLNQGVYAFIMKYRSSDHPEYFVKTGSINIIR